jgi:hypothetical protein
MSEKNKEELNKGEENKDNNNTQDKKKFSPSLDRKVKVISQTLFSSKVVVISKIVKPKFGPSRDIFNVYSFDLEGETIMTEQDAVLFWKDRKNSPEWKNDITVLGQDEDGKYTIEYDFKEVKDLYSVVTEGLGESEQQTTK